MKGRHRGNEEGKGTGRVRGRWLDEGVGTEGMRKEKGQVG